MIPPLIAGPVANPRKPRVAPPLGAWDTHAHIFGPAAKFPFTQGRGYTPPEAPVEKYLALLNYLGFAHGLIVQGNYRSFIYLKPRAGISAKSGTVLFTGISDGSTYRGTARRFSSGLAPSEYTVTGPIQNNGSRVVLKGRATIRNPDGSFKSTVDDVLVFDLIK